MCVVQCGCVRVCVVECVFVCGGGSFTAAIDVHEADSIQLETIKEGDTSIGPGENELKQS